MSDRATAVSAWEALLRAQVAVMQRLSGDFPSHNVSFNEYDALFNLSQQPDLRLRLRDLNQHLLLTQPSVSRLVDRLAAKGFVVKEPDPSDARGTIIRLTEAGHAIWRRVANEHAESIARLVGAALEDEELAQLDALASKLRRGLPRR